MLSPILSVQSRLPDKGRTTDYRDMGQHDHTQILSPGELEQALQALGAETLTLVEAAAMCGYSNLLVVLSR
jgi:hypothetical protein